MTPFYSLFAATYCKPFGGGFFGFPTWYKYLQGIESEGGNGATVCSPHISSIADFLLIIVAGIDILLRIAAIAAIVLVVYGAVLLLISQGEPDRIQKGRQTIINAIAGLAICVVATSVITFVAGSFS